MVDGPAGEMRFSVIGLDGMSSGRRKRIRQRIAGYVRRRTPHVYAAEPSVFFAEDGELVVRYGNRFIDESALFTQVSQALRPAKVRPAAQMADA
jgi:hypothetical protein